MIWQVSGLRGVLNGALEIFEPSPPFQQTLTASWVESVEANELTRPGKNASPNTFDHLIATERAIERETERETEREEIGAEEFNERRRDDEKPDGTRSPCQKKAATDEIYIAEPGDCKKAPRLFSRMRSLRIPTITC